MRQPLSPTDILERDWQAQVLELAQIFGWRRAHFRAARTAHGWRTPVQGDGAGFPDLCLVRERVVWAELKRTKGKLSSAQAEWHAALAAAGQEIHVWRPDDLDEVARVLQERRPTVTVAA